jgi:carboxylesterase
VTSGFSPADVEPYAFDGGPVGVVLCHGFTGAPGSMRPWGGALAKAGLTVRVPLLPGHGTRWQDANKATWQQWYATVEASVDEVRAKCSSTFVMGLSMGSTLTIRLAEQRSKDLAGIVVVNPSLFTTRKDAKLLPLLRHVVPALKGIGSDIKKPGVLEPAYPKTPLQAAYQLALLWKVTNADLSKLTVPLLVMTSRNDHVVETANSERLMAGVSSSDKRQIWLEDSYHVATLDNDLPLIIEQSLAFTQSHAETTSP